MAMIDWHYTQERLRVGGPDAIAGTCDAEVPGLVEVSPGHSVRCYLHSPQTEPIPETPEQPRRALGAAR